MLCVQFMHRNNTAALMRQICHRRAYSPQETRADGELSPQVNRNPKRESRIHLQTYMTSRSEIKHSSLLAVLISIPAQSIHSRHILLILLLPTLSAGSLRAPTDIPLPNKEMIVLHSKTDQTSD